MKSAKVVIGAGFGDEGKGLMTDYFSARYGDKKTVVRFNGGAQAGHTVVTSTGLRHVFGHFGSGTFNGSPTHLSRYFISNPALFRKEWDELSYKMDPAKITVTVDIGSLVTTPYDMGINQMVESLRTERHGSCGVGINETIERNKPYPTFTIVSLADKAYVDFMIHYLSSEKHIQERLVANGLPMSMPSKYREFFTNPAVKHKFKEDIKFFLDHIQIVDDHSYLLNKEVIFEGAQGLLLDQNKKQFWPHVTSSNTGLTNVIELAKNAGVTDLDVTYVTRCYATRHGVGKFIQEENPIILKHNESETNVWNQWQSDFRTGKLDLNWLIDAIDEDLERGSKSKLVINHDIAVTCLDQIDDSLVNFLVRGITETKSVAEFEKVMRTLKARYFSYGPTRQDIRSER